MRTATPEEIDCYRGNDIVLDLDQAGRLMSHYDQDPIQLRDPTAHVVIPVTCDGRRGIVRSLQAKDYGLELLIDFGQQMEWWIFSELRKVHVDRNEGFGPTYDVRWTPWWK